MASKHKTFYLHENHAGVYKEDSLMGNKPHKLPSNSGRENNDKKDQMIRLIWTTCNVIYIDNNELSEYGGSKTDIP